MSRHTITVHLGSTIDENAVIGFDPPLNTYFLQAFCDEETDEPKLWFGTRLGQFANLESLILAVNAKGGVIHDLSEGIIAAMVHEAAQPHRPSLVERHGWPLR